MLLYEESCIVTKHDLLNIASTALMSCDHFEKYWQRLTILQKHRQFPFHLYAITGVRVSIGIEINKAVNIRQLYLGLMLVVSTKVELRMRMILTIVRTE